MEFWDKCVKYGNLGKCENFCSKSLWDSEWIFLFHSENVIPNRPVMTSIKIPLKYISFILFQFSRKLCFSVFFQSYLLWYSIFSLIRTSDNISTHCKIAIYEMLVLKHHWQKQAKISKKSCSVGNEIDKTCWTSADMF